MKYLYIEVEIYVREFDSRYLLSLEAAKRGFEVYIGHRNQIYYLALNNQLAPGIIHKKDINTTPEEIKALKKLQKKGFIFTSQDEESGVLYNNFDDFSKRRFDNLEAINFFKFFFAWGERDKKYLESKIPNSKCVFVSSGSPRIDLCKESFLKNDKYFTKRNHIKKKYILISSNIQLPIGFFSLADASENVWKNNLHNREWKEENIYVNLSRQPLILYELIKCIRFLSKNLNDYLIVIRPHPTEKIDSWNKILGPKLENVKIIRDLTIIDNLAEAEILIHAGCMSAIESYFAKIPALFFYPIKLKKDRYQDIFCLLNPVIDSKEALLDYIIKNKYKNNSEIYDNSELKNRISNYDKNDYAYSKIIYYIDKIAIETNRKVKIKKKNFIKVKIKNFIKKLIFKESSDYHFIKFPPLDKGKIKSLHDNFCKHDTAFSKVRFELIDEKFLKVFL